jgi:hypothetical protein
MIILHKIIFCYLFASLFIHLFYHFTQLLLTFLKTFLIFHHTCINCFLYKLQYAQLLITIHFKVLLSVSIIFNNQVFLDLSLDWNMLTNSFLHLSHLHPSNSIYSLCHYHLFITYSLSLWFPIDSNYQLSPPNIPMINSLPFIFIN